jgi:hypothetical protein
MAPRMVQYGRSALMIALLLTGLAGSCEWNPPEKPELVIWGPASSLASRRSVNSQSPEYQFKLTIINFGVSPETANASGVGASCRVFGTDAFAAEEWKELHTEQVADLSIAAGGKYEAVFAPFRHTPLAEVWPNFLIDCYVDPKELVSEVDESNNRFIFFFTADCINEVECFTVQQGESLSFVVPSGGPS